MTRDDEAQVAGGADADEGEGSGGVDVDDDAEDAVYSEAGADGVMPPDTIDVRS